MSFTNVNGPGPFAEQTIPYLTFMYATLVSGMRNAFLQHPDPNLRGTKITLTMPQDRVEYPAIIVEYFGRRVWRAGIANVESISSPEIPLGTSPQFFHNYAFEGDIQFKVIALDTLTRARMIDSVLNVIAAQFLDNWADQFFNQLYNVSDIQTPASDYNYLTVNSDELRPVPNSEVPTPWDSENARLYQGGWRTNVLGQVLTLPNNDYVNNLLEEVILYPNDNALANYDNPEEVDVT